MTYNVFGGTLNPTLLIALVKPEEREIYFCNPKPNLDL